MVMRGKSARVLALLLLMSTWNLVCAAQVNTRDLQQDKTTGRIILTAGDVSMSPQDQIQAGRKYAAQVAQQMPVLPESSPVTKYVQALGRRLALKAPGYKWPFEFRVINQKDINAFALPGGPVFVNLGTIQMADESELAGVMAHEISHVVLQHTARDAGKEQTIQTLGALGSILAGAVFGNTVGGRLAQLGIQIGASGIAMKYSRADETEADLLGSQIMYDAGYDPYAMVEFFDQLAKQGGPGVPQFLADHPNPGNRAETVRSAIEKFPRKQFARHDSPEFVAMKRVADHMHAMTQPELAQYQKTHTADPNASQPVNTALSDVMPSGNTSRLDRDAYSIEYPDNWQVYGAQGSSVTIAPQAGVSQNAVAYGASVSSMSTASGTSLETATRQVIATLERENQGMKAIGSAERIRVNGGDGRSVDLTGISPVRDANGGQLAERDWLVTLQRHDGSIVSVVFTAPQKDFDALRPAFEHMLKSLRLK